MDLHYFFYYSFVDGDLGCFYFWAIMNNDDSHKYEFMCKFLCECMFLFILDADLEVKLSRCLIFSGSAKLFSKVTAPFYIPRSCV